MKREYCDRCGAEIYMRGVHRFIFKPYILWFTYRFQGDWITDNMHVMCSDCRKAFDKWMKGAAE